MFGGAAAERSRDRFGFLTGLLIATAFLVASCGGGGGGGGGGGSGDAFSISTNSVTFTATLGQAAPPAQTVNVAVNFGQVFVGTTHSGTGFSQTFALTGPTTGAITITPIAPTAAGTFTGTITVRGCSSNTCGPGGGDVAGSPKTINVTYNVAGAPTLSVNPSAVDFQATTGGTAPPDKTVDVAFTGGSTTWNASVSYGATASGWLTLLSGLTGTTPQTVGLRVGPLPVAGAHTATVTFTAVGAAAPRTVLVTLTVSDPRVNFVSPYVATTLTTGDVIIRGHGFAAGGLQVLFNNTPATAVFVSETEILATHPALTAGSYVVNVNNGGANMTTRANLVVADLPTFPAVTLDRSPTFTNPGAVGQLIYDAERQAVFLMDAERNRIERYRFNGIGWDAASLTLGSVGINPRMALSPDGTELLKTSNNALERINASTFTNLGSVSTLTFTGGTGLSLNRIAFANDGRAIGSSSGPSGIALYRYDMLTQQFASLSTQSDMTNRNIVASGDGHTIVLPTAEPLIPSFSKPVFVYDASQGQLLQTGVSTTQSDQVSLTRNGSRILMTSVTASDRTPRVFTYPPLAFLGDLGLNANASVITPDGTHLYVYFSGNGLLRKFSIAPFSEVGVPINVGSLGSQLDPAMTISPDGSRIFLAGNQRLVILSVPVP